MISYVVIEMKLLYLKNSTREDSKLRCQTASRPPASITPLIKSVKTDPRTRKICNVSVQITALKPPCFEKKNVKKNSTGKYLLRINDSTKDV